jgi:hypothetical protein
VTAPQPRKGNSVADNKIVHRVSLEGADKVAKQLESIGDIGEKSFKRVKNAADGASSVGNAGSAFGGLGGKTEESRLAAERLREALHTLHPVLESAGLGLGNLGAFARVASAGFYAFGAAVVGAVVVALARMGDEAIVAKKRLGDLLQNPVAGGKLFESLKQQAHDLKTPISNLLPAMESLIELRNKQNNRPNERYAPGAVPSPTGALSNEKLLAAQKTLFEGLKGGGASADEATKAMSDFNGELAKTGRLSADMVQNLAKASPGFANTFAQSLQRGLGNSTQLLGELEKGAKISAEDIINDLVRIGPAVHQALAGAPKDAKTFSDALDGAKASASELLDVLKGPNVSIPILETLSKILDQDKKDLESFIGLWEKLTGLLSGPAALFDGMLSKLKSVGDFLKKAATDPGALHERDRNDPAPGTPLLLKKTVAAKSPNQHVAEDFDQFPKSSDDRKPGAHTNDAGSVNPYGGQLSDRTDGYTHPFGQAPRNEAERRQQIIESAKLGANEGDRQKLFNQNIRDQNGGNRPTGDKDNYAPPVSGHYDPVSQAFVASKHQPPVDRNAVPGAPRATTFPAYQRRLIKEFQDKFGPSGNPTGVENPATPKGLFAPGINPDGDPYGSGLKAPKNQDLGPSGPPDGDRAPLKRIYVGPDPDGQRKLDEREGYALGGRVSLDGGGHIRGAGTSTSDSIPAMLSDGEYVVKADAVSRVGVDHLDAINSGTAHFADGGTVKKAPDFTGSLSVTYDPNTGGAWVNGNLYPPGSPFLNDPRIKAAIARSKGDMKDDSADKKSGSDFTGFFGGSQGNFAKGGLVGDAPSRLQSIIRGFANGGIIDIPHLAIGGMPEMPSPDLSSSLQPASSTDMPHHGTVDLRTDHGDHRVIAHEDTMRSLNRAAVEARTFGTGPRPGWHR